MEFSIFGITIKSKTPKDNLTYEDAINAKKVSVILAGKEYVLKAMPLSQAVSIPTALKVGADFISRLDDGTKPEEFEKLKIEALNNAAFLIKELLPGADIDINSITFTEFADFLIAIYAVNDLGRVIPNFTKAMGSMLPITLPLATLPK